MNFFDFSVALATDPSSPQSLNHPRLIIRLEDAFARRLTSCLGLCFLIFLFLRCLLPMTVSPVDPSFEGEHKTDRRVREVYRYFQPSNPAALNTTSVSFGDNSESTKISPGSSLIEAALQAVSSTNIQGSLGSPNVTLNSFAQLAALRLNVRRALIRYRRVFFVRGVHLVYVFGINICFSILDRESQFILAEGTQTSNINNPSVYGREGDGLWAGCSTVVTAWSLCKVTPS